MVSEATARDFVRHAPKGLDVDGATSVSLDSFFLSLGFIAASVIAMVQVAVGRRVSCGKPQSKEAEVAGAGSCLEKVDEAVGGQRLADADTRAECRNYQRSNKTRARTMRAKRSKRSLGQGEQGAECDASRERLEKHQIWLLALCRGTFQMARNCFGPLAVSMATEYAYTSVQKGELLSAFANGYAFTQIIGGMAADYFGSKPLLVLGLLTSSGSLFLVPVAADAGMAYLYWLLFLMGVTQGPTYPAQKVAEKTWATTANLKSIAGNLGAAGSTLGSLLALGLTFFLDARIGWRRTAWFFGTLTGIVGILEVCIGSSAPVWIQRRYGCDGAANIAPLSVLAKRRRFWFECRRSFKVLFAPPVLATFAAHSTANFVRYFLTNWMPTYYREVLEVSADASAVHLIIPEIFGLVSVATIASLDLGTKLPQLTTRRLFSSISFLGAFLGLIAVSMVRSPLCVTAFLCFVQGLATLQGLGFNQSYTEVTRNYAGLISGVGNTAATLASDCGIRFAGWLIPEDSVQGPEAWQMCFLSFACANLFGLMIYSCFCSVTPVDKDNECCIKLREQ